MNIPTFRDVSAANITGKPVFGTITIQKPLICPHCAFSVDGTKVTAVTCEQLPTKEQVIVTLYSCTVCKKIYLVLNYVNLEKKSSRFGGLYPALEPKRTFEEQVYDISPSFVELYNQALAAEASGHLEIAAMGYRSALEFFIKDYAIKVLEKDAESVKKADLYKAIELYLENEELANSADVIRILGNDYTHYDRKRPEFDFDLLKKYVEVFVTLIEAKLKGCFPPLKRS